MAKKNVLGRGLSALIDGADTYNEVRASVNEIEISKIVANPFQPRTTFDEEALNELAASIKEIGIIQPITLRKIDGNQYQIIAGERRFRAAKIAGLTTIPTYIRTANDEGMLEMALVENIQREDLDAIEIALSYQRLIEECKLTQEVLSDRVGKKRSTVTNYLRLLKLPAKIQKGIV
jgi:ParB family chromosome partitioning protein